jgi:hypothetical protein
MVIPKILRKCSRWSSYAGHAYYGAGTPVLTNDRFAVQVWPIILMGGNVEIPYLQL